MNEFIYVTIAEKRPLTAPGGTSPFRTFTDDQLVGVGGDPNGLLPPDTPNQFLPVDREVDPPVTNPVLAKLFQPRSEGDGVDGQPALFDGKVDGSRWLIQREETPTNTVEARAVKQGQVDAAMAEARVAGFTPSQITPPIRLDLSEEYRTQLVADRSSKANAAARGAGPPSQAQVSILVDGRRVIMSLNTYNDVVADYEVAYGSIVDESYIATDAINQAQTPEEVDAVDLSRITPADGGVR